MKQECPTYLKSIGKSKALVATLSDIEREDDSNNEDDGILNAFATVRDRAPSPFYDIGPNPREWVELYCCLSKWRFDWLYFSP